MLVTPNVKLYLCPIQIFAVQTMIISNLKSQHRYLQCKFVMFRPFQHLFVHPSHVKRWLRETFFLVVLDLRDA